MSPNICERKRAWRERFVKRAMGEQRYDTGRGVDNQDSFMETYSSDRATERPMADQRRDGDL